MLTEVDTREVGGLSVALFMDTEAQVYLVCVEGYEPIQCLTRDRAVNAYRHPYAYLPLEGAVSPSNGIGVGSPGQESNGPVSNAERLTERTQNALVELKCVLEDMDNQDFIWTTGIITQVIDNMTHDRWGARRPYNHDANDEDLPFC